MAIPGGRCPARHPAPPPPQPVVPPVTRASARLDRLTAEPTALAAVIFSLWPSVPRSAGTLCDRNPPAATERVRTEDDRICRLARPDRGGVPRGRSHRGPRAPWPPHPPAAQGRADPLARRRHRGRVPAPCRPLVPRGRLCLGRGADPAAGP